VELAFELPSGGLSGRVLREDGHPLDSPCRITVERRREGGAAWTGGDLTQVWSSRDGDWSCGNLDPGRYRVGLEESASRRDRGGFDTLALAERPEVLVREREITGGVDLVVSNGGIVEGTILTPDGRPVNRAVVYVRDADGSLLFPGGHEVVREGRYSLVGLPAGRIWLEVFGAGFATPEPRSVDVEAGQIVQRDLRLAAATSLTIELAGCDGIRGDIVLSLRDAAGREQARARRSGIDLREVGEALSHTFGPLPPGAWHAAVRLPDGRISQADFVLAGENERTVVLGFD